MYCGRCGADDNDNILIQKTEQDGDSITISYYGRCKECGELLGFKEFYKMTDYDYIGEEEIKKVLCELKAGVQKYTPLLFQTYDV